MDEYESVRQPLTHGDMRPECGVLQRIATRTNDLFLRDNDLTYIWPMIGQLAYQLIHGSNERLLILR
jgi:hypothetical protein